MRSQIGNTFDNRQRYSLVLFVIALATLLAVGCIVRFDVSDSSDGDNDGWTSQLTEYREALHIVFVNQHDSDLDYSSGDILVVTSWIDPETCNVLKGAFEEGIPVVSTDDYRFLECFHPSFTGAFDGKGDVFLGYRDIANGKTYVVSSDSSDYELTIVKQLVEVGYFTS